MTRLRRSAATLVLALIGLGIAASAGAALASGGCCVGMPAAHGSGAPCHSVAPTSCCEASASGSAPGVPGAPLLAGVLATAAPAPTAVARVLAAVAPAPARAVLATTVLRL